MAKVEVYSSGLCGYCRAAKQMLDKKGVEYTEHSVDYDQELRTKMVERAGGRTSVPQIFIDDFHVGGFDDLMALEMDGKLDSRLGLTA